MSKVAEIWKQQASGKHKSKFACIAKKLDREIVELYAKYGAEKVRKI